MFPLDTGREHGIPTLSARPKGLEWVWPFYLLLHPTLSLKENCKAPALHEGYLPKLLFLLAPHQDVTLSPFKPPVKGTQVLSLRPDCEKCQVPWRRNAKTCSSHKCSLPRSLGLCFQGCEVFSAWSQRSVGQALSPASPRNSAHMVARPRHGTKEKTHQMDNAVV